MTYDNINNFPFNSCDIHELSSINSTDRYFSLENNEHFNTQEGNESILRSTYLDDIDKDKDFDINLSNLSSCKYYSCGEFQNLNINNNLNIYHNNVNGLETKFKIIHNFLSNTKSDIDIITITETSEQFINENFKTKVELDGYKLNSKPTLSLKGGVAIYTHARLDIIERTDLDIVHDHYESIWVEIKNKNHKNVICGVVYRHPHDNMDIFNGFLDYMESLLSKISTENKDIYVCGDFNTDLLKIEINNNYKKFYELMFSYGFLPNILLPTRVQGDSATIVDNIFTNNTRLAFISGNILTDISDHYSQFISIQEQKLDFKSTTIYRRDYSNFSEESFRDDVSIQDFNNNFENINEQFHDFYNKLEGCVNRHAPVKKLKPKEVKLVQKPWISKELNKMIKIKNKLFYRKKRQPNNTNVKRLYNLFRNRVNRELKKSKIDYYSQYFEDNSKNSKKLWEGIKSIINTNNSKFSNINQLNVNNVVIDNPKEIVEAFNDFFVNVGPNTEKDVPINPIIKPDKFLKNTNQFDFVISNISIEEVLDIINQLESKSTGPQSIPVKLLKLIPDLIIIPLCKMISNSFSSGVFPESLKISKVIPIHKDGSTQMLNNYRPISLLSVFDKIIEKLMHKRLYNFLTEHNILFHNQFGFRKNNSTSYALIQITERIKESIDEHKYGCGIFIDLRKAFDTVNHNILLT